MPEDKEKQASFNKLEELFGDTSKIVFLFIHGSSNGKRKFEQDCLESYAKKFGLHPVEPNETSESCTSTLVKVNWSQ